MAEIDKQNEKTQKTGWIDVSYALSGHILYWPQDPVPPDIKLSTFNSESGTITMSQMTINSHHGTHVDSPRHFYPDGTSIDQMPLDTLMGPVRIIEIKATDLIEPDELAAHDLQPGERILFKSINSTYYTRDKFVEDFVHLSIPGAHFLVEKKVSAVGIDYLAIGSFRERPKLIEVHQILLGGGIWIIEALDLTAVSAGRYEMICLPIKIERGDAAQARVILRPI